MSSEEPSKKSYQRRPETAAALTLLRTLAENEPAGFWQRMRVNDRASAQHIASEIVVTFAREAMKSRSTDESRFVDILGRRLLLAAKAQLAKLPLAADKYNLSAVAEELAQDMFVKIATDTRRVCFAETSFGRFVRFRAIDFVRALNAAKRAHAESDDCEEELVPDDLDDSPDDAYHRSPEQLVLLDDARQAGEERWHALMLRMQLELSDKELMAITLHYLGHLQVYSKNEEIVTVCKLMNVRERTARKYLEDGIDKLKGAQK